MSLFNKSVVVAGSVALAAGMAAAPASAQFYKGKTLNVIINYGAGGNTDIQGRSVMRFMGEYIAGKPRVVVKNMPGAGGIVATNYLALAGKRDGSMVGVFTFASIPEIIGDKALKVKHADFVFIGAIGQQQIVHVRKDILPGGDPKRFVEITKVFKSAGHAPSSSKDIAIKLTLGLLGIKHEHVTGFKSAGDIRRAILQNSIQYTEDSLTGYYAAVYPTLIKTGISVPLWHVGVNTKDGGLAHAKTVEDSIPTFLEVYKSKHGPKAVPSGVAWQAYRLLASTRQTLRIIVAPKGIPKKAVDDLREAWSKTTKDKGYLAEYQKLNNSALEALVGQEAEDVVADILDVKPDVRTYIRKLAGM